MFSRSFNSLWETFLCRKLLGSLNRGSKWVRMKIFITSGYIYCDFFKQIGVRVVFPEKNTLFCNCLIRENNQELVY